MSSFHDQFTQDEEFPQWYHWNTSRPFFPVSAVKYSLYCDGQCYTVEDEEDDDDREDEIEITAYCENGNGFGSYQEKCWKYILENAGQIERELRRKIWHICRRNFHEFIKDVEPDDPDWAEIKTALDWQNQSSLESQIELTGVGLIDDGFDEVGFSTFDFAVGWDDEHGLSVVMHKDRVLAAGGGAGFSNRGSELIPHVKFVQGYDFTEGDWRIPD